jgi:1,6-anhydro-N-acetylmuramate kinase
MVDPQLLKRLSAAHHRKRFIVGIAMGPRCRSLRASLVVAEGQGLSMRCQELASLRCCVPQSAQESFARLREGTSRGATRMAHLAAQLAESQAALLERLATQVASLWNHVLAVSVADFGIWCSTSGWSLHQGLRDSARLAELSGLNVIDAFADRDVAVDGTGRNLDAIAWWILLRHRTKPRIVINVGQSTRLTLLPPADDSAGIRAIRTIELDRATVTEPQSIGLPLAELLGGLPAKPPAEIIILGPTRYSKDFAENLAGLSPQIILMDWNRLGIARRSLKPDSAAILGLLHIDQAPANVTAITGARKSRVLGTLTPGSLANWHRLVQVIAAARPSVISLRSAV